MDSGMNNNTHSKAIDPANMDTTLSPAEDFYQFAVGRWLRHNPIPPEYSSWGSIEQLVEKNLKDLRTIFEEAAADRKAPEGSMNQKIGDFYGSGMNTKKIEQDGLKYLRPYFSRIEQIKRKEDVRRCIAYFHTMGVSPLFQFLVDQDPKNSDINIVWLYQAGLGLPDRDYYLDKSDQAKKIREKYIRHMTNMFELLGDSSEDGADAARRVMKMETRLAKASMTRLERRDPKATHNKMSLSKLAEMADGFDFPGYFKNLTVEDPGDINVAQPKFFKELGKMIGQTRLGDWQSYLRWHLILKTAPYLNKVFEAESFDFYGTILMGAKKLKPRWKRCLLTTSSALGEMVGRIYVERYFPPEARARALELVENLKKSFRERIKKLGWMSKDTRKRALGKLAAFGVKIGYPDEWIDYSRLEIDRQSYVLNVLQAENFEFKRNLAKVGKPVDRGEWEMTPQTVNAYYHPSKNEIVFPAAILQPPFFYFTADDAVNYGAIGAVIAHEMIHGFDDQGRQYDKEGNLNDWWSEEEEKRFKERTEGLVSQFGQFEAVDDVHINGELTLGENIADLGGLNIALDAFREAVKKKPPPGEIDGFTPVQRFFLSWAQIWRRNIRKETLLLRLKTDVHSPDKFRTNGPLINLEAFHSAFNIKPGQPMYLPPEKRVTIW